MIGSLIDQARGLVPAGFADAAREPWPAIGPEIPIDLDMQLEPAELLPREPGQVVVVSGDVEGPPDRRAPELWGGIDALAWYRSYHIDASSWGIYLRSWGVGHLARHLGAGPGSVAAAYEALWVHEYSHFIADVSSTVLEINRRSPAYLPHLRRSRDRVDSTHTGWCFAGEAVATARQLDALAGSRHSDALRAWVRTLPRGYRDATRYERRRGRSAVAAGQGVLLGHLAGGTDDLSSFTAGAADLLFDAGRSLVDDAEVPLFWVYDDPSIQPSVESLLQVARVDETREFTTGVAKAGLDSQWSQTRRTFQSDPHHPGLRFKKLHGSANQFSIRVGRGHRAILRLDGNGVVVAERFGKRDSIYR